MASPLPASAPVLVVVERLREYLEYEKSCSTPVNLKKPGQLHVPPTTSTRPVAVEPTVGQPRFPIAATLDVQRPNSGEHVQSVIDSP
ncbi:hypothetical protein D9611_010795 [Ephemerocybe angulata]|uniref:Uncharacterized protein n=1 Tax=Ephemerocybe angulata TaxID=980116 RepID=A0A8H5BBU5_9AGAR|nr:hypothetical protein D9611_010795 [Tulosesus angulatus]